MAELQNDKDMPVISLSLDADYNKTLVEYEYRYLIEIPSDLINTKAKTNLDEILHQNEKLLKKELNLESLEYSVNEKTISFHWFNPSGHKGEEGFAMYLIALLINMAVSKQNNKG